MAKPDGAESRRSIFGILASGSNNTNANLNGQDENTKESDNLKETAGKSPAKSPGPAPVPASRPAPAADPPPTNGNGNSNSNSGETLPAYSTTGAPAAPAAPAAPRADIIATYSYLPYLLRDTYRYDTVEGATCLAHLKLLYAFHALKEEVGYTDGLWGIRDDESLGQEGMSRLREKRWAVYLTRAVHRYEVWWESMAADEGRMLTLKDMEDPKSSAYDQWVPPRSSHYGPEATLPSMSAKNAWSKDTLVPLDVLMVFHAHMLNPRDFLEDCMLAGYRGLWTSGLPWKSVTAAINSDFEYCPSEATRLHWTAATGLAWDNADDPMTKAVQCPACPYRCIVPWTTWAVKPGTPPTDADFKGSGYGDGNFSTTCVQPFGCGLSITRETLCAGKFVRDVKKLIKDDRPMPGTVLHVQLGTPKSFIDGKPRHHVFPSLLIRERLRTQCLELFQKQGAQAPVPATMADVRRLIEGELKDVKSLASLCKDNPSKFFLPRVAKMATRKMMSRYHENHSVFALDLVGAVLRQGVFIDKMHKLDWLHSPSAKATMGRLITKYHRFLGIMKAHPRKMVVPTLDVDLAWHTAQLTPLGYYRDIMSRCYQKFVDHDDKVGSVVLQGAFEWTSKTYQKMYGEVYSECTCWYCESMREKHVSIIGSALKKSKQEKVAGDFHQSGKADLCPPDNSAHMSAHNSVQMVVMEKAEARHEARMKKEFEKARKRAEKKGKTIPSQQEYYNHWGHTYFYYGPWVYPTYYYPGMYYAGTPAAGCGGGCAAGTCSQGMAVGACGGPGGCGACGTDGGSGAVGGCTTISDGGGSGGGGSGGGGGGDGGGSACASCGGGGGGCGGGG